MSDSTNKKTGDIRWLLQLAETKKANLLLACLLSVFSAALSFAPYVCVYFILRVILENSGNLAGIPFSSVGIYAWVALGTVILGLLFSFLSSVLSHGAAYKIWSSVKISDKLKVNIIPFPLLNKLNLGIYG